MNQMFNKLISTLTLSTMLLHSIFGCCTHHAHACDQSHADGNDPGAAAVLEHVDDEHPAHSHSNHRRCSNHDREPGAEIDSSADHLPSTSSLDETVHHNAVENRTSCHGTTQDSHAPCPQECDGRDCCFTLASPVKTPSPEDVRLCFPLSAEVLAAIYSADVNVTDARDPGPPAGRASCRCRPMTQVWQL